MEKTFSQRLKYLWIFLILFLCSVTVYGETTTRQTVYGTVSGFEDIANTWAWLGIPYAKPPVGTLRWQAPQNPDPWEGVKETKTFKDMPPQYYEDTYHHTFYVIGSEDCLYLNIWRPRTEEENLPVYFWIHGGGNSKGDSSDLRYYGANLAGKSHIIVVTINYRLGPLGWFACPALRSELPREEESNSGNFGILDMIQALQWVKENISAFGGDPDNVTIAGESAGAYNVLSLLTSPLATGLFHKAIMQSGSQRISSMSDGEEHANDVVLQLMVNDGTTASKAEAQRLKDSWTSTQIATYLRSKTAQQLLETYTPKHSFYGMIDFPRPLADGVVLPTNGYAVLEEGTYVNKVPIILGSNLDEMKLFLKIDPYFEPKFNDGSFWDSQPDRNLYRAAAEYGSQCWKIEGVDDVARKMSSHEDQPGIYAYRFDWGSGAEIGSTAPPHFNEKYGACHTLELPFFFGHENGGFAHYVFNEENRPGREALSSMMMAYVLNFMRTGNPNGAGLPVWEPWTNGVGTPKHIIFNVDGSTQEPELTMSVIDLTKSNLEIKAKNNPLYSQIQDIYEDSSFDFLPCDVTCTINFSGCLSPPITIDFIWDYCSLQDAYDHAYDGDNILVQALAFTEPLVLNRDVTISLSGGFDCGYTSNSMATTLNGKLIIEKGSVIIDGLIIQ